MQVFSYKI